MQYSCDQTSCLKFLDLFCNELLPLQGLLPDFLLDRSGMWADIKVVLDYLPRNTGDVRWLPSKHNDIRPQEGNERAFLFVIKGGTDSKGTISTSQLYRDLFHMRCNSFGSLAIGTLRHVINRCSAHQRGMLLGFLAGTLFVAGGVALDLLLVELSSKSSIGAQHLRMRASWKSR